MSSKVRKIAIPSVNAGFIKDSFNPNDLLAQPGIYTTYSNTDAYPILMAMVTTHLVEHITTNYIDSSTQQPIVRVTRKDRRLSEPNPVGKGKVKYRKIKVAAQVIKGTQALGTYAGWQPIWWREAIQNARDAGAKNIDCGSIRQENGNWLIWFQDDGKGMSLEILEEAFLKLGGSSQKEDTSESVGGFGKAKEILLFPWIHYKVYTGTHIAYSERSKRTDDKFYEVTSENEYMKGVRIEVLMPDSNHTHVGWLLAFLSACNTPGVSYTVTGRLPKGKITLADTYRMLESNSDSLFEPEVSTHVYRANLNTGRTESIRIGDSEKPAVRQIFGSYVKSQIDENGDIEQEIIDNTLLAEIYIRPQPKNNPLENQKLLIRDRGVYMFGLDIDAEFSKKFIAFVELRVPSKFLLTENRDSIRNSTLEGTVNRFVREIEKEQEEVFKKSKKLFFHKFYGEEGAVAAQTRKRRKSELESAELIVTAGSAKVSQGPSGPTLTISQANIDQIVRMIDSYVSQGEIDNEDIIGTTSGDTTAQIIQGTRIRGADQLNNIIKQTRWKPNFGIKNENEGEQPPKKFFPENMSPGVLKIAKYWTEFVKWTLAQLDIYREFNVGFVFTTDAQGMYVKDINNETGIMEEWILINPIILEPGSGEWDFEKKKTQHWITKGQLIKISNEEHLRLMYAVAIHECTHMQSGLGDRDANFPVVLTYNIGKCAGFKEVRKLAKTIVAVSAKKERASRPSGKSSTPSTQETGIFYVPSAGRGRPKVVKTFGVPSEIQFRYMWENKPADGWAGLECRLEIIVEYTIVFSDTANMGTMLSNIFHEWWAIRNGSADSVPIIGYELDITSNGDRVILDNRKTGNRAGVDIRSFLLVIHQMTEEIIAKRINFIVSQSKDREARALRNEWKRIKG